MCGEDGLVACGCSLAEIVGGGMGCLVKVDVECGGGSVVVGVKGRDDGLIDDSGFINAGLAMRGQFINLIPSVTGDKVFSVFLDFFHFSIFFEQNEYCSTCHIVLIIFCRQDIVI